MKTRNSNAENQSSWEKRKAKCNPSGRWLMFALYLLAPFVVVAQTTSLQVKVFDRDLQPVRNIQVAFNDLDFFKINDKGTAIVELDNNELPLSNVRIKDEQLEAASWNISKGVVEIIVRPRTYRIVRFIARFADGDPVSNATISFHGEKMVRCVTGTDGRFELPVSLTDRIMSSNQFTVDNYNVIDISMSAIENVLIVERPRTESPVVARMDPPKSPDIFDPIVLDTVNSLSEFYRLFRAIPIASLDETTRAKIDNKFRELIAAKEDSISAAQSVYIKQISDSSFVAEDIKNLLRQATIEGKTLEVNRSDFETRIDVITSKLQKSVVNMTLDERNSLLQDIDQLEKLLTENESLFFKNHNDYREIINALKEKYFDIQMLQTQLSESEQRAADERKQFRQRMLGIGAALVVFGLLTILLISFSGRLRRQKRSLQKVNSEIETINANLEAIVEKRTRLLQEANKELDTFLYRASHDLRSPIRSIIGLCQIMDHIPQAELMDHVERMSHNMDRILNKLIDISEIAQEATRIGPVSILNTISIVRNRQLVISNGVNVFRNNVPIKITQKPIQFDVKCPPELVISTSNSLLEIILSNLIENALFFAGLKNQSHSQIEVSVEKRGEWIEIAVFDNGVGFSEGIKPQLFTMFFIGNPASKGNGLGLYTVQKCVNALSGTVKIDSVENEYTKVLIRLPMGLVVAEKK